MILSQAQPKSPHRIFLIRKDAPGALDALNDDQRAYATSRLADGVDTVALAGNGGLKVICGLPADLARAEALEKARLAGHEAWKICHDHRIEEIALAEDGVERDFILAFCEGFLLSNYAFRKYKTPRRKFNDHRVKRLCLAKSAAPARAVSELNHLAGAVFLARDLVNEPLSYLTAVQYSRELRQAGKNAGFKVTVFGEEKIKSMKMGGILAVNKGSVQPATFNILEYKPEKPANSRPVVLVGKGVVFDTGGLSLKPTANSMDYMKCDMAGSAVVAGVIAAAAKNKLPLHVVGLIPAVENRPGGDAIVPGDVITMYDGTSVEVMNTDAEGRLILADALTYARKYSPALVIDVATLTGAAAGAIGPHGIALMAACGKDTLNRMKASGEETRERVVEFPLWDEFADMLESQIADIKNHAGGQAGAITAGKFLQHFTDYPWVHLDIAGVAFLHKGTNYRGIQGTGTGVRLLYHFLKNLPAL